MLPLHRLKDYSLAVHFIHCRFTVLILQPLPSICQIACNRIVERRYLLSKGDLPEMGYYVPSAMNATVSYNSLYSKRMLPSLASSINREEKICRIQQVCMVKSYGAELGPQAFLSEVGGHFGGAIKSSKQRRLGIESNYIPEPLHKLPLGAVGNFNRRSRGDISVGSSAEERMNNEQRAAEFEETEAASTRVLQSSNVSSSGDKRVFIFGFGYTSCALASYIKHSWKVSGTCRTEEKKAALQQCGYSAHVFNSDNDGEELREEGLRELQQASHWLISVPPVSDFDNDPVLTTHAQDLNEAVGKGIVRWIGYLSSTGVYGDWQGDLVDEESIPRPLEQRALARLAAEDSWLKFGFKHGVPVLVFRLGGIYGPGRSAIDTVLKKQRLSARQQSREQRRFTSRIHVADVCQTILSSMENPELGEIFNVVDDDPASRIEVLSYAMDLLNDQDTDFDNPNAKKMTSLPNMALGEHNLSSPMTGEKRVSNKRIKLDLKVKLLFPTYRQGLKQILDIHKSNGKVA